MVVGAYGNTPLPNPVSSEKLTEIIQSFHTHKNLHHSISLTGGEPLEQSDFLKEWLPYLRADSPIHRFTDLPKIYLETNGLLPVELSEVIDLIDIIGMDIKLPSVAKIKPFWSLHRDFLKIASRKEVFVKVVVSSIVNDDDMIKVRDLVSSISSEIPFVIQPCSPLDMDAGSLLRLQEMVSCKIMDVRVIPQVHKFINLK